MNQKLAKLVDRLQERTNSNHIQWQRADRGVFTVSFPNYSIDISGDEWVTVLRICNSEGEIIEAVSSDELPQNSESVSVDNGMKLRELHKLARRSALRSDEAIDDLISVLES
jgi:hypothetical protein